MATCLVDWAKLSTSYYLDEAIAQAGEAAEVLFLRCIAYSGAKESRGRVSKSILPMLAPTKTPARLAALIREGLLVDDGEHVLIRSWDAWQESLDKESDKRRKDRERKAAERLAASVTVLGQSEDVSEDVSVDSPRTCPPVVLGLLSREVEVEVEVEESKPSAAEPPTKPKTTKGTPVPNEWPPTPTLIAWVKEHAPHINPEIETEQWLDHHRAKGTVAKDWTASWRTWMRNAKKFDRPPVLHAVGQNSNRANPNKEWS